jgi:hypothetical protein
VKVKDDGEAVGSDSDESLTHSSFVIYSA